MKKSLVSLGLATALVVPAGAAYAQSDEVPVDTTTTCRSSDGAAAQIAYGAQHQARLDDEAPYGDPGLCLNLGDPMTLQDRDGSHDRIQAYARLEGGGVFGNPEDCPYGAERVRLRDGIGAANGGADGAVKARGSGFGRTGSQPQELQRCDGLRA